MNRITTCAERFAPSNFWYVSTMVKVFELAGEKVKLSVAQTLMTLIAEGSPEDNEDEDEGDEELRAHAVEDFILLMDKPNLPLVLAETVTWVLGMSQSVACCLLLDLTYRDLTDVLRRVWLLV